MTWITPLLALMSAWVTCALLICPYQLNQMTGDNAPPAVAKPARHDA